LGLVCFSNKALSVTGSFRLAALWAGLHFPRPFFLIGIVEYRTPAGCLYHRTARHKQRARLYNDFGDLFNTILMKSFQHAAGYHIINGLLIWR
jgi:hypothetical protein